MIANLITKLRSAVNDNVAEMTDEFEYSISPSFTLTMFNISAISSVEINGVDIDEMSNTTYTLSGRKLTFTGLVVGDKISVDYTYTKRSDTELEKKIGEALDQINIYADKEFIIVDESGDNLISPVPTIQEQSLITVVAGLIVNPLLASYSTANHTIKFPTTKDKDEKIVNLITKSYSSANGFFDLMELYNYAIEE
jgi:hypothetical protein